MRGAVKPGVDGKDRSAILSVVFRLLSGFCSLVTQTSNPAFTPGAPGGRLQPAETRWYANQASLQHIALV